MLYLHMRFSSLVRWMAASLRKTVATVFVKMRILQIGTVSLLGIEEDLQFHGRNCWGGPTS